MDLITEIGVHRFRSIDELYLPPANFTALVGGNGSGKSNVLRALNLFFNEELEAGVPLDLGRDFHKPWRTTRGRSVAVSVEFSLPPHFAIHQKLVDSLAAIGINQGAQFALCKTWTRDPLRTEFINLSYAISFDSGESWTDLDPNEALAAARFLRLIVFRYIPNHVHPSELMRAENAEIQNALIVALKRSRRAGGGGQLDAILREMGEASKALVKPIATALFDAPGHVEGIELSTPTEWAEVAWTMTVRLQAADVRPMAADLHGSGNQSFLAYVLLAFLDTRFGQRFGWHQATVWGIEEPESFLHADLKNALAGFLANACAGERFQAFATTHDLVFGAAADANYLTSLKNGETEVEYLTVPELADRTLASGVTSYVHPLNLTEPKPTLMVDGPYDVFYIESAYRHAGRPNPWDIRCLETLDAAAGGSGKAHLKKYLKANTGPLRARPTGSPVIVLLDWEDSEADRQTTADIVAVHPTSTAIVWPADLANPEATPTFKGIERYLGTDLIETTAVAHPDAGITRTFDNPPKFQLAPARTADAKQRLQQACAARNNPDDVAWITAALDWLEGHIPAPMVVFQLPGM
jgi:energy-coupling factor transporter ATP-binding protein EcfA2